MRAHAGLEIRCAAPRIPLGIAARAAAPVGVRAMSRHVAIAVVAIRARVCEHVLATTSSRSARRIVDAASLDARVAGFIFIDTMTVVLLAVAAVVSLGVVAMCKVCRDR